MRIHAEQFQSRNLNCISPSSIHRHRLVFQTESAKSISNKTKWSWKKNSAAHKHSSHRRSHLSTRKLDTFQQYYHSSCRSVASVEFSVLIGALAYSNHTHRRAEQKKKKLNLETEKLSADLISTQRALMFPAVSIADDNLFKLTLNDKMKTKRILWNEGWDDARPQRKDSYQVLSRKTITIGEGTRKLILKNKKTSQSDGRIRADLTLLCFDLFFHFANLIWLLFFFLFRCALSSRLVSTSQLRVDQRPRSKVLQTLKTQLSLTCHFSDHDLEAKNYLWRFTETCTRKSSHFSGDWGSDVGWWIEMFSHLYTKQHNSRPVAVPCSPNRVCHLDHTRFATLSCEAQTMSNQNRLIHSSGH